MEIQTKFELEQRVYHLEFIKQTRDTNCEYCVCGEIVLKHTRFTCPACHGKMVHKVSYNKAVVREGIIQQIVLSKKGGMLHIAYMVSNTYGTDIYPWTSLGLFETPEAAKDAATRFNKDPEITYSEC